MEVKIGVQYAPRELVIESSQSPTDVEGLVNEAMGRADGVLTLVDERGRRLIVPVAKIAYVEIAEAAPRSVGFSVG